MKKLVLIALGFALLALASGVVASSDLLMGFSRISKYNSPDLIVRNTDYAVLDWDNGLPGIEVTVCNYGKTAVTVPFYVYFESLNSYSYSFDEGLPKNSCSSFIVSYYYLLGSNSPGKSVHVEIEVDSQNDIYESNENNNFGEFSFTVPTCGNNVCEDGESQVKCPYDCEIECSGPNCGSEVYVSCGCEESEKYVGKVGLITNKGTCDSCAEFEDLFYPYAKMQTGVYECLSDYFDFEPPRVPYSIFYYPNPGIDCGNVEGCYTYPGSAAGFDWGILMSKFSPVVGEGVDYPTEVGNLYPDVHEMTHYFIGHMLHGVPNWFNEAVAMQTTERLSCGVDSMLVKEGVAYDAAINASGILGDYDIDYYKEVMVGEIPVPSGAHANGALFVLGMEADFGCTEDCFAEIVSELRGYEEEMCMNGECGIDPSTGIKIANIDNDIIYKVVTEVVGSEPNKMFEVLDLSY